MAPVSDVELDGDSSRNISREDCLCPICLEIFMEPVTLPCTHTFCKVCFLESVDKATLCCPLCRKRVSTWARQNSRNKSLVNEPLWKQIQAAFPLQSERRLQGQEAEDGSLVPVYPRLCEPGALRQEYEDQISKLTEEKRELEEQERRASEEFIQRLLAEEEQLLQEQQRRREEDERLARILSRELNSVPEPQQQSRVQEAAPVKKKTPSGQIERFLCPVSRGTGCSPAHSTQSNKENILVHLNTPTDLPRLDYYGPETDQSQREEVDQSELQETAQSEREEQRVEGGTKRKSSEVWTLSEEEEEEETQGKRSCQSSCLVGVAMEEWEAELQRRRTQEEEDRRLALELQRELDRQVRETDRRKGSADAYPLRAPRRKQPPTATATLSTTLNTNQASTPARRRTPTATVTSSQSSPLSPKPTSALSTPKTTRPDLNKTPKTSQKSPQTPKCNRQTTLTDLFNLHT